MPMSSWHGYPDPDRLLRVTTTNDVYARLAAQVAETLGLPGPDASSVARSVSKAHQICDIVRDSYGFDMVESLLYKLQGSRVVVPELFAPRAYARVEFLLDGDPLPWDFSEPGKLKNGDLHITYGPQRVANRERRGYLYVRHVFQPSAGLPPEKTVA
jgi:hypothetical protein